MAAKRRRNRSRNRSREPVEPQSPVAPLDPAVEKAFDALDELYAPGQTAHRAENRLAAAHEQVLEDYFASFQSRRASSRTLESCRLYLKYLTEKSFPDLVFFSAI